MSKSPWVVLSLALAGCAAKGDPSAVAGNAAAVGDQGMCSADKPSAGYTLKGSGPTAGVTLEVPSGAVPAGTVVGMGVPSRVTQLAVKGALPSNLRLVAPGTMLEVTPAGTLFTVPVTLKVAAPDPALGPVIAAVKPDGADTWHLLPVDVSRGTATITTDRAGIVAVYLQQLCATGACASPDPCHEAVCQRNTVCAYPVKPNSASCTMGGVCCAGKCVSLDSAPVDCRPPRRRSPSTSPSASGRAGRETRRSRSTRCGATRRWEA